MSHSFCVKSIDRQVVTILFFYIIVTRNLSRLFKRVNLYFIYLQGIITGGMQESL